MPESDGKDWPFHGSTTPPASQEAKKAYLERKYGNKSESNGTGEARQTTECQVCHGRGQVPLSGKKCDVVVSMSTGGTCGQPAVEGRHYDDRCFRHLVEVYYA